MKTFAKLTLLAAFCSTYSIVRAADDPKTDPSGTAPKAATKSDAPAADGDKKPKGRLPANYGKVVSDSQKAKIYDIQAKYAPKIAALREQLNALTAQQTQEMRALLTPEQLTKLDELTAAAKARRNKAKPDDASKTGETAKPATDSAKPGTTPPAKTTETAKPADK